MGAIVVSAGGSELLRGFLGDLRIRGANADGSPLRGNAEDRGRLECFLSGRLENLAGDDDPAGAGGGGGALRIHGRDLSVGADPGHLIGNVLRGANVVL